MKRKPSTSRKRESLFAVSNKLASELSEANRTDSIDVPVILKGGPERPPVHFKRSLFQGAERNTEALNRNSGGIYRCKIFYL